MQIALNDTGIVSPQPSYATRQWLLERWAAVQSLTAKLITRACQAGPQLDARESFNDEQFAAVVAVREVGRRNGDYRGEKFNDELYGRIMAERERRRLTGDES